MTLTQSLIGHVSSVNLKLGHHDEYMLGSVIWSIVVMSLFQDTTMRCPVQKTNRESTTVLLPTCAHMHRTDIVEILAFSAFPKDKAM